MDALTDLIGAARAELARENAQRAYELLVQTLPAHPQSAPLLMALAEVLTDLDRPAEALETYHRILTFEPTHAEARRAIAEAKAAKDLLLDLAFKAEKLRAFEEARENYEAVIHEAPYTIQALARLLFIDGIEGRLAEADRHHAMLVAALTRADLAAEDPELLATVAYQAIMRPLPPALLATVTGALDDRVTQIAAKIGPLPAPAPKRIGRLKIGYLSNHFRDHPIGHVTAALFAAHDRSIFEVHVFYMPTGEPNPYTEQIRAGAEHFHTASIGEMAHVIAQQSLDLLIYLDGYMVPSLLAVMARRPAPKQIFWLGHAGGCDLRAIDRVIADEIVWPEIDAKVMRLGGTYHPASPHAIASEMSRADAGLPQDGFVFCAFNNPEKIDTPTFDMWVRILKRTPGSLLWLSRTHSAAIEENLRAAAGARGIDGSRLVFARRLPDKAAHLARHRHAGLFLDTLGLNASTTALDALWAGLPVLTVTGTRFASRIATSFLTSLALPELICGTVKDFEERAVSLATDPAALAGLRERLAAQFKTRPLFQIETFCRTLENALVDISQGR